MYIKVGNKNRKVFHAFTRWKHSAGEQNTMNWCTGGTNNMWAQDFPYAQAYSLAQAAEDGSLSESFYTGSKFPVLTQDSLTKVGEELREFVVRDLFIKANSPRFGGAVFLFELHETVSEIRKLFTVALKKLLKGKSWNALYHLVLSPHELWLWYRYALFPAILDINSIIEATKPKVIDRVQDGRRTKAPELSNGTILSHGWFNTNQTMGIPWTGSLRYGIGGAIDMHFHDNAKDFGFGNWDVIMGVWERIPFSFLVDWLINVGDWLASLRDLEVVYAQSYATYAVESTVTFHPEDGDRMFLSEEPTAKSFLMSRIVDLEPPQFPLIDRRWRNLLRTIDSTALLIGILKKVLRKVRK
jgi:hypothetical protein